MFNMMNLRGGLKFQAGIRFTSTRSLAKSNNDCPSNLLATKSKAVKCPHTTPGMTKLAAESAKAEQTSGFLSKRWSNSKKCPKFCSYMDRQCPPLVPPIVKPKLPVAGDSTTGQPVTKIPQIQRTPPRTDVPFAAVMAYRLCVFGAKLGVAGYCVKWTIDNGIWGSSKETSEKWEKFSTHLHHNIPQLNVLSGGNSDTPHTLAQCWNGAVFTLFDAMVDASRWVKRKAVDKERQAYGLPPLETADEVSLKSRLDGWTERWWLSKNEDETSEENSIKPDSPEYYGTKPGSAITEEDDEQIKPQEEEKETQIDLQSLEMPDFQLDLLITNPTLEQQNLSSKPVVEHECTEKQTKAETQEGNEENDSNSETDDIKGDELREVAVRISCHCDSDILLTTEGSPCSHPQCPRAGKPEESTQQAVTETN